MGSQHLQRTTATVGKVATMRRKQYGNLATAEDDSNSKEGSINQRDANNGMGSQHTQMTTATVGEPTSTGSAHIIQFKISAQKSF